MHAHISDSRPARRLEQRLVARSVVISMRSLRLQSMASLPELSIVMHDSTSGRKLREIRCKQLCVPTAQWT